jgi:hypothetical protein
MRKRLPKVLVISGALMVMIGVIAVVTMLVVLNNCQHSQLGFPDDPSVVARCSLYQTGTDWGFFVLVVGAVAIVIGGICSTALIQIPKKHLPTQ